MNLGPPSASPTNQRPHQQGRALGTKAGAPVQLSVEWLVDTGADVGGVHQAVGNSFDLVATAASASPTTGGGGMIVKTGLQVEFTAEDAAGAAHTILASQAVAVKSNNSGSNVIGVDQLAGAGVTVDWDAAAQTGTLEIKTPPPAGSAATSTSAQRAVPAPPPAIVDHGTWLSIDGVRVDKRLWRVPT
jgi:hypothetical protein